MMRSGKVIAALIVGAFLISVLLAVGPVMRESDQASLVDGGLVIARDGEWLGANYYNYSRQFVSYWAVAVAVAPHIDSLPDVDALVEAGNRCAAAILAVGVVALAMRRRRLWQPVELAVLALALFCPVWWFSAPLLASNVIAAGFVLLLVVVLSGKRGGGLVVTSGLLTFLSVGARSDVALILPMIVLLAAPGGRIPRLLRDATTWAMGLGAVLALVVGRGITESPTGMPTTFFDFRLFGAYVAFGLNGLALAWGVFFVAVVGIAWKRRSLWWAGVAVAWLLPWVFYAPLLYSPRHLVVVVTVVLATLCLPRGRFVWEQVARAPIGRWSVVASVAASVLLSVVGLRMDSLKSVRPQLGDSTWYPTADGLWPMGANVSFYQRLAKADQHPLDHNQLVWNAWREVDESPSSELVPVYSSGLTTYGELRLRSLGAMPERSKFLTQGGVFDSRTFLRRKVDRTSMGGATTSLSESLTQDELNEMECIGSSFGAEIYRWGDRRDESPDPLNVRALVASRTSNDRMTLGRLGDRWQDLAHAGRFEWIIALPEWRPELADLGAERVRWNASDWTVIQAEGDADWLDQYAGKLSDDAWVARSTMVIAFRLQ